MLTHAHDIATQVAAIVCSFESRQNCCWPDVDSTVLACKSYILKTFLMYLMEFFSS